MTLKVKKKQKLYESSFGKPLQIIYVKKTKNKNYINWKIGLNENNLTILINNISKHRTKKISVISLLGQYRTGKSFLLDLMLLRLNSIGDEKWWRSEMKGEDHHLFTFRKQRDRVTTGIWFYSKPFVNGETTIILMDTQGLFDLETPMEINKSIFSISTLLSSYQIFNVQNRISEDGLQQLEFFTEFARSAIKLNNKNSKKKIDVESFKFQRLEFLIRDWTHYEEDDLTFEVCQKNMMDFLKKTFKRNTHDDGMRIRVMSMFEEIVCFGLPHPGSCVEKKDWDCNLKDLEPCFVKLIRAYFNDIFNHPVEKKPLFPGQIMSPELLKSYIISFVEVFQSGQLPKAMNLSKAFARSIHLNAKEKAFYLYNKKMEFFSNTNEYFNEECLKKLHNKSTKECLKIFEARSQYGKQENRLETLKELKIFLNDQFKKFEKINKNRMPKLLNYWSLPLIISFYAYMFDWFSDYTCDWWSEECVKFSMFAKIFYTGLISIIFFEGYCIYDKKGKNVLRKSIFNLLLETVFQIKYWHKYELLKKVMNVS